MGRIRTIKPEFPQSESMGRVSRDARLLFVELWTICDDEGRARANSRMLASLLFPYDDDAPGLIDGWLEELEREGCIVRYAIDGNTYLQIAKWLDHQKIDRASRSKIPPFDEASRIIAKARERSCEDLDQGPRTKDLDQGEDRDPMLADASVPLDEDLAFEIYNEAANESGWPIAERMTQLRRASLRKRLAECGGIPGWRGAMQKALSSAFLTGKERGQGHEGWRPNIDFFLQPSSFTKLQEGGYDNAPRAGPQSSMDTLVEFARSIDRKKAVPNGIN